MKALLLFALLLLMQPARAQPGDARLADDPVFTAALLRRISYPVGAERSGIFARIYAGFRISAKGHVQDVYIMNPTAVGYGFEDEVIKKIKRLPPVQPRYAGEYVLPVVFAYLQHRDKVSVTVPAGRLPDAYFANRTLLREWKVMGTDERYSTGRWEPLTQGQVYTTP